MTACATLRNAEQYKVDNVDFFLISPDLLTAKGNAALFFFGGEGNIQRLAEQHGYVMICEHEENGM